jgi:hypothetical protein
MSLLLLLHPSAPPLTPTPNPAFTGTVNFVDETGLNPLPAGLLATIYSGAPPLLPANIIGAAYLQTGGVAAFANVQPNSTYTATFVGAITQVPSMTSSCTFTTGTDGPTIAAVVGYVSSALSVAGYAAAQTSNYPLNRFDQSALVPGGNAYNLAYGLAALLARLDLQTQTIRGALRLQSSQGIELDSWAYDFFGPFFTRCAADTDATWYAEILAILQTPKCTIAGLQRIITTFLPCILTQFKPQTLAYDTAGAVDTYGGVDVVPTPPPVAPTIPIGADNYGGVDAFGYIDAPPPAIQTPSVLVFDSQSNPALSAAITPNIIPGQFCVYLQFPGFSDAGIHPIAPISPLLAQLVALWKSAGPACVFAANITS